MDLEVGKRTIYPCFVECLTGEHCISLFLFGQFKTQICLGLSVHLQSTDTNATMLQQPPTTLSTLQWGIPVIYINHCSYSYI